jgi:hypothetical protein
MDKNEMNIRIPKSLYYKLLNAANRQGITIEQAASDMARLYTDTFESVMAAPVDSFDVDGVMAMLAGEVPVAQPTGRVFSLEDYRCKITNS